MAKRYAFWRKVTGEPDVTNGDKHAPSALLDEIGRRTTVLPTGGISRPFPDLNAAEFAIDCSVVIHDSNGREINENDAVGIIGTAIQAAVTDVGGGKPLPPALVLKKADKATSEFLRLPLKEYIVLTSLSIKEFPAKKIRIQECDVSPVKNRRRFRNTKTLDNVLLVHGFRKHAETTAYMFVGVKAKGRTPNEAFDRATDALHLLRGMWTLLATYGSWSISMGAPRRKPIGVIHNGPIYTLHNGDGSGAIDYYWYEPDYSEDKDLFSPKGDDSWDNIESLRRKFMRKLQVLPYRADVEQLIIRYASALDHSNLDIAFLQMWSILERITQSDQYDVVIKRATWLFEDRNAAKERLEFLRTRRNRYVHAAKSGERRDQVVYMIKSFVEPHLLRLIRNDFGVKNLLEYSELLSLPTDAETLRKRQRHVRRALKMFGK